MTRAIDKQAEQGSRSSNALLADAIRYNDVTLAEQLISEGADVDIKNNDGWTPLHFAVFRGNIAFICFLVENGADVNAENNFGNTPLYLCGSTVNTRKYAGEYISVLVAAGADVNKKNSKYWTPLHQAAAEGSTLGARFLVRFGADVSAVDTNGDTALHYAAAHGNIGTMKFLIKAGASLYFCNKKGHSPRDILGLDNPEKFEKYDKGLCELENGIRSRRMKREDSYKTARTNFEFDI